jgi:hypothetical protein
MPNNTNTENSIPWFLKNSYFTRDKNAALQEIDEALTTIFTDTGLVLGASSILLTGSEFNHHKFKDGQVHTLHIYGNESATSDAGVYIPKEYSSVKITSQDTVIAANPNTGKVIMINHVQVGTSDQTLKKNMKTVRPTGTVYIGQIGGKGGEGDPAQSNRGRHSHLVFFPSESARISATKFKGDLQKKIGLTADYTPEITKFLEDFRNLVS